MRKLICILVLLSAVAAQAVNTTATLSDKSWAPSSQQTLIGHMGPLDERTDMAVVGQVPDAQNLSDGGSLPTLYAYPELSSLVMANPVVSSSSGQDGTGQPATPLVDSIGETANLDVGPHWSDNPKEYVAATGRGDLPPQTEIDWAATPLPTTRELSVMEVAVFPTLGALLVAFLLGMLIVRYRRRRQFSRTQQLLQV